MKTTKDKNTMNKNIKQLIREDFNNLKNTVKNSGYELVLQEKDNLLYIRLNNGIKHEIKYLRNTKEIRTAFGHKQLDEIKEFVLEKGYRKPNHKVGQFMNSNSVVTEFVTVEHWLELATILEDINIILKGRRGITDEGYFLSVAKVLRVMHETGNPGMADRYIFDKIDHLVTLNDPLPQDSYREHIVPLKLVIDNAFKMFSENSSDAEVAAMLQQNIFVYHITKQQAKYLDITLGLRTSMPKGWMFGDSVFARLDAAGIEYKKDTLKKVA
jgi:hypothetical protein